MNIKLTKPEGVAAGVEASCDVYHSDTHAFDMLYPEREESRLAAKRFLEEFAKHML